MFIIEEIATLSVRALTPFKQLQDITPLYDSRLIKLLSNYIVTKGIIINPLRNMTVWTSNPSNRW